jgi:Aromatic-ring hydroxylase, C-terminal
VLVRPDGIVAWRTQNATSAPERELTDALATLLSLSGTPLLAEVARG